MPVHRRAQINRKFFVRQPKKAPQHWRAKRLTLGDRPFQGILTLLQARPFSNPEEIVFFWKAHRY